MGDRELLREAKLSFGLLDFEDTVRSCRSYRRFNERESLGRGFLLALVDIARKVASAANRQPLRYAIVDEAEDRAELFGGLRWAAALKGWDGPSEGERPSGYLVIFSEGEPGNFTWCDCGIAAQTIALAAVEAGAGLCMLASFDPRVVADVVGEGAEGMTALLVLALGVPAETCVLESAQPGASLTYWRGPDGVHHVPKRTLAEVLIQGKE